MSKVKEKLQSNQGRVTNNSDPSAMKVWVTPPWKERRPTKVLAKGIGNRMGSSRK